MLVGLDEVKNYLRIDGDYDDGLIEGLMAAGQDLCLVVMRCRAGFVPRCNALPGAGCV